MKRFLNVFIALISAVVLFSCESVDLVGTTSIALDVADLTITVGETHQFSVIHESSYTESLSYTWQVSNSNIAEISQDGLLTAMAKGTVTVKVSAKDPATSNRVEAECNVTVNDVEIEGLNLSHTELKLRVNDSAQLEYTILPEAASYFRVVWSSSNVSVADVDTEGKILCHKKGTATITATVKNTNVSASCKLEVEDIPVESLTLNKTELTLKVRDTEKLKYTILPEEASYLDVVWASSDDAVVMVSQEGELTCVSKGEATVTATVTGTDVFASCKVVVEPIIATSVTITNSLQLLKVNETHQLSYELLPLYAEEVELVWSSSDDAVLTVDDTGLCTAISEGTVVVTVATTDGSLTDSVEIRVKDPFMKVGVPYVSKWGLECTVNEIVVNSDGMTMTCYVNYTQKNVTTDREITECVFQCNKASGEAEGQYGFFGSLFPNETMTRSYTFKTLANDPFVSLKFSTIFGDVVYPDADDLIWNLTGLY